MTLHDLVRRYRTAVVLAAALVPALVAASLSLVRDSVSTPTVVLLLVALVVLAGTTGLRAAGLVAAGSAALSFDFFLTAPYGSLSIAGADDVEATVLLLVIGGLVTETALWGQRQSAALSRQSGYLDGVLTTAETLATKDQSHDEVVDGVAERIAEVLGLDSCRFVAGAAYPDRAPVLEHDGSVVRSGHIVDATDGLPSDDLTVLPVRVRGTVLGWFELATSTHISRPLPVQRRVAALLADQVAASLADGAGSVQGRG